MNTRLSSDIERDALDLTNVLQTRGNCDSAFASNSDALPSYYGETEMSREFAHGIARDFRYVSDWQRWFFFESGVWRHDIGGEVTMRAKRFCDAVAANARQDVRLGARADVRERLALKLQSKQTVDNIVGLAKVEPEVTARADQFDVDDHLLNTPDGTVDLRNGSLRAHDREDLITRITSVAPAKAQHPIFDRFIRQITLSDQDLIDYLQRALGACLSGANSDHWIMFWYGAGRNGKNTLSDLMLEIMGGYAKQVPTQTLMADAHGNRHPTEVANLQGLRLAISSEVSDDERWNEARVKELTGDAVLTGRFMRGDFFEFRRTHKHIVNGNHRPALTVADRAIAARMHVVPFEATFDAASGSLDPQMPEKLRSEASAILTWLIEGHQRWLADGTLKRCSRVDACTNDYLRSEAPLDLWIEERCQVVSDDGRSGRQWPKSSSLFADYVEWKKNRGEYVLSQVRWAEQMQRRFRAVVADGRRWVGICLLSQSLQIPS